MLDVGYWFEKSVRMKTSRARKALMRTRGKPKNSTSKGAVGVPQFFFFTPNLILFVSINTVQSFKTVALPPLGEKFVVVGGGWWVVVS